MKISVEKSITSANDAIAAGLRDELRARGILCLNLISAPGSGKTALIEQTVLRLSGELRMAVIEGDPHTDLDSDRVRATGVAAVQINTLGGCHLDAQMVRRAVAGLDVDRLDMLIIENVGNLLCPAPWNLGEQLRVVMTSLPEGADKPLKYPEAFLSADAMVINKVDLEGLLRTRAADIRKNALLINPRLQIFELSCETGQGLGSWCDWLKRCRQETP
jgi:hydrogenase nickel incorporation protein HypB